MLISEGYGFASLFPRIPDGIKTKYSNNGLFLRPFGFFEKDLNIDFNQDRPNLVTQIIQCCTGAEKGEIPDQTFFWNLTIGKRVECLLTITALGNSSDMSILIRCLNDACKEQMEVEISLESLADLQHRTEDSDQCIIRIGDEDIPIRKPTGSDQVEWKRNSFKSEGEVIEAMIRTLISGRKAASNMEHTFREEWIMAIDKTMEEFDPLVNFSIQVRCPHCETEGNYDIDIEELSLHKLREAQSHLFQAVHLIASHYHWSEEQILSLPPWRRSYYLDIIKKEENQ